MASDFCSDVSAIGCYVTSVYNTSQGSYLSTGSLNESRSFTSNGADKQSKQV